MEMLNQLLTRAALFVANRGRLTFELILIFLLLIVQYRYNSKITEINKTKQEAQGLVQGLQQQVTIANDKVEILTRQKNGSVVYKQQYVPPEGQILVREKEQQLLLNQYANLANQLRYASAANEKLRLERLMEDNIANFNDTVIIKNYGFVFRPGGGADYAGNGVKLRLDAKVYFWRRWSLLIGGSPNGIGPAVSHHLDFFFWHPQNLEIFGGYNPLTFNKGANNFVFGLRSNF